MIKKSVGFERASDVLAIVYSVKDGSAVFVVPNGFVVLEVPLSQTQAEYFKMYEKSPNVFVLHGTFVTRHHDVLKHAFVHCDRFTRTRFTNVNSRPYSHFI